MMFRNVAWEDGAIGFAAEDPQVLERVRLAASPRTICKDLQICVEVCVLALQHRQPPAHVKD